MFPEIARLPSERELARDALRSRDWVVSEIAKLKDDGAPACEIRAWEKHLRSREKLIKDYGFERFA